MKRNELSDYLDVKMNQEFNKSILNINTKVEEELSNFKTEEEKYGALPGLLSATYSLAAMEATKNVLIDLLDELNILED